MGADTKYYVKIPVITYDWVETYALTSDEAKEKYPSAIAVLHWSQYEAGEDDE